MGEALRAKRKLPAGGEMPEPARADEEQEMLDIRTYPGSFFRPYKGAILRPPYVPTITLLAGRDPETGKLGVIDAENVRAVAVIGGWYFGTSEPSITTVGPFPLRVDASGRLLVNTGAGTGHTFEDFVSVEVGDTEEDVLTEDVTTTSAVSLYFKNAGSDDVTIRVKLKPSTDADSEWTIDEFTLTAGSEVVKSYDVLANALIISAVTVVSGVTVTLKVGAVGR